MIISLNTAPAFHSLVSVIFHSLLCTALLFHMMFNTRHSEFTYNSNILINITISTYYNVTRYLSKEINRANGSSYIIIFAQLNPPGVLSHSMNKRIRNYVICHTEQIDCILIELTIYNIA